MKAVLLCAGYATRLRPLTENQPKPLLKIGGRPILDHILEKVEKIASLEEVFVVTNARFYPQFLEWVGIRPGRGRIRLVNDGTQSEETRLGAIGDLAFVVREHGLCEDLGVFAGDNLFEFDLEDFMGFAERHRPHASLGVVDVGQVERARQYGIVKMNTQGQITEFFEKPEEPPSTLASTGIYWFPKETLDLLDRYTRERDNADRPGDYIRWLVKVDRVFAHPFQGTWLDIGSLETYQEAERWFEDRKTHRRQNRE